MPLEIKELHIKVNVNPGNQNDSVRNQLGRNVAGQEMPNTQGIIAACVEQVMEILKEKAEA